MGNALMSSSPDLNHRLAELSLDEQGLDDKVTEVLRYAEAQGVNRDQLRSALDNLMDAASSTPNLQITPPTTESKPSQTKKTGISAHLSTTSVLFYIGGILLFIGIVVGLYQENDATNSTGVATTHGLMGALFWTLAYFALRKPKFAAEHTEEDSVKTGMGDSLALIGSLFLFACAGQSLYLIGDNLAHTRSFLALVTAWLASLALIHYALDHVLHRLLLISLASLTAIATFYSLLWTLFLDARNVTVYTMMVVMSGIYTFAIGSLFKQAAADRRDLAKTFQSLGGFIVMSALYSLLLTGSHEMLWTLLYPSVVYGAFIYSIRSQSKTFLATGSLFLITYVSTIIAKYFAEGLGPAVAFIVAAGAITVSAIFSLYVSKRYFPVNPVNP